MPKMRSVRFRELASVREARDEAASQADVALRRLERANRPHKALQGLHQRLTKADAVWAAIAQLR